MPSNMLRTMMWYLYMQQEMISKDVDTEPNFPDDNVNYVEVSDSYIRVGSLTSYGSNMVAMSYLVFRTTERKM